MELGDHMGFLSDVFKGTRYCLNVELRDGAFLWVFFFSFFLCVCLHPGVNRGGPVRTSNHMAQKKKKKKPGCFLSLCAPCSRVTSRGQTDAKVGEFVDFPGCRSHRNFVVCTPDKTDSRTTCQKNHFLLRVPKPEVACAQTEQIHSHHHLTSK